MMADKANDQRDQAALLGRLANLRRTMAKDLQRPEHASAAYTYFTRAQELAARIKAPDVEGRILADWSLLYSDSGQAPSAKAMMDRAMVLAPQDPNVNVDEAVHLYRAQLFPEMQRYVEKALFLEPSNWQALWYQVKLSEKFYDTPKLIATLKEILHFYPWSKVASDKLKSLNFSSNTPQKDMLLVPPSKQPAPAQ
jgi:tetratricopeptide (TPR) repeat protein